MLAPWHWAFRPCTLRPHGWHMKLVLAWDVVRIQWSGTDDLRKAGVLCLHNCKARPKKDADLTLSCGHGNLLGWLLLKRSELGKHNRAHGAIVFYQSLTLLSHVATSKSSRHAPYPSPSPLPSTYLLPDTPKLQILCNFFLALHFCLLVISIL